MSVSRGVSELFTYMPNPELDNYVIPKKRPLVSLLMAECFFSSIFNGEKTITIREGWRDYHVGEKVVLCRTGTLDDVGWATMAKITKVSHCFLKEVPIQDLNDDGMATLEDAVQSLGEYYENINEKSMVTVIRWELI